MITWNIDAAHTEVAFKIRHLGISNVRGVFSSFKGKMTSTDESLTDAKVSFEAETKSIDTRQEQRDIHLRSADFFEVEKFPTLSFESTSFTKKSDGEFEVKGMFTMKGVAKEITLNAMFNGVSKGQDGKRTAGFEILGGIDRKDFAMNLSAGLETVLGQHVSFDINTELKEE